MPVIKSRNPIFDEQFYERAALSYSKSLPMEHYMESTAQATQRAITLDSFALITAARPDVHCFNELLVQYPRRDIHDIGRVVPDNMVVVHDGPITARGSYNLPFQPARPFLVMEYVSAENRRKDYSDNMLRYEQDLRVPYYLLFEPEKKELILFRHPGPRRKYQAVPPGPDDRMEVPELDLHAGLVDGWVRFWFRGRLLPLPAELAREAEEAKREARTAKRKAREADERAREAAAHAQDEREAREAAEAELERLRAELKRLKGGNGSSK